MQWTTTETIIQVLGFAVLIVFAWGIFLSIRDLKRLEEAFAKPLRTILFSFILFVISIIVLSIFVFKKISYENYIWIIPIIICLIGSIILVKGGKRLFEEIRRK